MNSRFRSGGGVIISRGEGRFNNATMRGSINSPGPGNYNTKMEMNNKGTYSCAKYKNSGAPLFTRANRDTNLETSATRKSKNIKA